MLSLVLCAALSQNPRVAVVQSSNLGVPPKRAAELTNMLVDMMIGERLDPVESKVACADRACLVATATKANATAVISVALASLGKDTVMDLECVLVDGGKSILQTTFTAKQGETKLPFEATVFAADARRALAPSAPPAPPVAEKKDAPVKEPTLTPEPAPAQPVEVVTTSESRTPFGGITLGVAALAVGVVAVVLGLVGTDQRKSAYSHDENNLSPHTAAEARAIVSSANLFLNLSPVLGGVAGALAIASIGLFVF